MECRNGEVQPMPKVGDNNFAPPPQVVFAPFLKYRFWTTELSNTEFTLYFNVHPKIQSKYRASQNKE